MRNGFTIIEVIIALTLLACGALAIVGASAAAVRAVDSADRQRHAITTARERLEDLAASGCSRLSGGTATDSARGLRESWRIAAGRNGVSLVTDSVTYVDRAARRLVVLHRLVVC
jgi:prepilin-type N-terminal cleavage/methylation domain-containing protein